MPMRQSIVCFSPKIWHMLTAIVGSVEPSTTKMSSNYGFSPSGWLRNIFHPDYTGIKWGWLSGIPQQKILNSASQLKLSKRWSLDAGVSISVHLPKHLQTAKKIRAMILALHTVIWAESQGGKITRGFRAATKVEGRSWEQKPWCNCCSSELVSPQWRWSLLSNSVTYECWHLVSVTSKDDIKVLLIRCEGCICVSWSACQMRTKNVQGLCVK